MLGLGLRLAILLTFAVFFIAPVVWLILAPTKSDQALIMSSPFSFGDFHHLDVIAEPVEVLPRDRFAAGSVTPSTTR